MADFQPHGGTAVELRGRVLVFRSQAHLNREEVVRLQQETARRLHGLAGKPWAVLGVVDKPVLLTADAEAAAKQALSGMVAMGLKVLAVAFNIPTDRSLVEAQTTRIVAGTIPHRFFGNEAEAEAWLNAMLDAG
jgi:hypothetical protein